MRTLTAKAALGLMADVVLEYGADFVYKKIKSNGGDTDSCFYVVGEAPSCLVGHILHRCGVPLDYMGSLMHNTVAAQNLCARINGEPRVALTIDVNAALILQDAQDAQDAERSWGTALAVAALTYAGLEES